ncbi:TRAP transporter large permease subunit [Azoarcus sp. TTM-91]|uniref:TRAP transporter large permease n=1 Tax=Azoarcus sp. TTM-91 TaxID=2691581 RepID=UPI00145F6825|nr:TRAP transporter large permease [Azoarcus sp. TTM-91]NMG36689.1 TRAP transporter large permease subunit [Azoarcus sp. TTM-91]
MIGTAAGGMLLLLALSIPVAAAMGLVGLMLGEMYSPLSIYKAVGQMAWNAGNDPILVSIPFFVLLGELLLRSGIGEGMYGAMVKWLSWLPGGLMHSNIGTSAIFSATCGSSVATAATVGTVAIPQCGRYGYNERLFLGTVAAGGTLGILIPPSINLVVYGALTNTSIPALYMAAMLPGILLALLFMVTILLCCLVKPEMGGKRLRASWAERIASLKDLLPPLAIFVLVVGSIYIGVATPTEAAALGVLGSLFLVWITGRLNWGMLRSALEGTLLTTGMMLAIIIGAYFLNFVLGSVGITRGVSTFVQELDLPPMVTMLAIVAFYFVLGMFMETLSMMVATVPIIAPVVVALGFDPVWFGILVVLLIETAMITGPVGINLFVVQGLRKSGGINDVIVGALPFVGTLLAMIALMLAVPDVALLLPRLFGG